MILWYDRKYKYNIVKLCSEHIFISWFASWIDRCHKSLCSTVIKIMKQIIWLIFSNGENNIQFVMTIAIWNVLYMNCLQIWCSNKTFTTMEAIIP